MEDRFVLTGVMSPKWNPLFRPELLAIKVKTLHRSTHVGEADTFAIGHRRGRRVVAKQTRQISDTDSGDRAAPEFLTSRSIETLPDHQRSSFGILLRRRMRCDKNSPTRNNHAALTGVR